MVIKQEPLKVEVEFIAIVVANSFGRQVAHNHMYRLAVPNEPDLLSRRAAALRPTNKWRGAASDVHRAPPRSVLG